MKLLILIVTSILWLDGFSQSISGRVIDEEKNPIEYASIRLLSVKDSTVKYGVYTGLTGGFTLDNIVKEHYLVKVTYVNHAPYFKVVDFTKNQKIDLGIIQLALDAALDIEEVTAAGSLDVLKAGIDKKIYSVQDDISVRGGSVNDVLNNIPSIEVDQDGNISLRGDGNVTILIDGRPSALVSNNGQSMLESLPANAIERIEVVTNPSAKYDPDGTSGIINIVLKKNKLKGFNGMASVTGATGNLLEGNLGLSYRNKRFNTYVNYSFNYYEGYRNFSSILNREVKADSSIRLEQNRIGTDKRMGHGFTVGSDFYINDRNSIGVSAAASIGKRERTGNLENRLYDGSNSLYDRWDRNSLDPREHQNIDLNANYKLVLKEKRGEWSFNANQSIGNRAIKGFYEELYYTNDEKLSGINPLNQQLDNAAINNVSTIQSDFEYLFTAMKARMEVGAKWIYRDNRDDTYSETKDTLTGLFYPDTLANYRFDYNESIYSLYGVFGQELGKFKYQLGVRSEYAEQVPNLISKGEKYTNHYFNLFPSAHLKYGVNKASEFSLSYSRRINRANARQLNPFTSYADPFNLRGGNPELQPEYVDSYDLGYSFNSKKVIFSTSVFHRRTKDVINRVKLYREDNTAIVTYDNIDNSQSTGGEIVVIYKPFKWMKNTISTSGNYIEYSNKNADWSNDGFIWNAKYILHVDFWKNTASAQLNAAYRGPRVSPQGIVQRRSGIDLSFEKKLLSNKLAIGAKVSDIFNNVGFELALEQPGVSQVGEYKWLTRRFFLTISYKWGNMDKKSKSASVSSGGAD